MSTMTKRGTRWAIIGRFGHFIGIKHEADGVTIQWSGWQKPPTFGSKETMRDFQRQLKSLTGERFDLVNYPDDWEFKRVEPIL